MPIVVTFDITNAEANAHGRLKSLFERLGWDALGGTAYRYPKLGTQDDEHPVEDWFNHVIPALMLIRAYATSGGTLTKFSLDANSSTGYNPETKFGKPPVKADEIVLYESGAQFGEKNLKDWIDSIVYPYQAGQRTVPEDTQD